MIMGWIQVPPDRGRGNLEVNGMGSQQEAGDADACHIMNI